MVSYSNISRWLSFKIDPIAVEDFVANREIFGPPEKMTMQEEELEKAYQMETGAEISELLLFRLEGKPLEMEVSTDGEKTKKMKVNKGDFFTISPEGHEVKLKIKGKNVTTWQGGGKQKIVIEAV